MLPAGLLLLAATTLLATGSLYTDTVAQGGLRRAILDAPPADRSILVSTTLAPDDLASVDAAVAAEVRRAMAVTGGQVHRILRTPSFADATIDPEAVTDLTLLASYDGIGNHATLVEGSWPARGGDRIEAAVSEGAAVGMGLTVGDEITLVSRLSREMTVDLRIVGLWRPHDDDGYWLANQLELTGVEDAGRYVTRGPLVVDEADLLEGGLANRLDVDWRGLPDVDGLRIDTMGAFRADLQFLDERLGEALPSSRQIRSVATLPTILDEVDRAVLVSRSGVLLLTIQFAVLAVYAVILVGGLLLERRRAEVALLRSRGAGSGHLLSMAIAEGLLLGMPAAAIAPLLAFGIVQLLAAAGPLAAAGIDVPAQITPAVLLVSTLAGLGCVVALSIPVLTSGVSLAGVRAAIGRQTGRTLPQRLGIDLALVVLAAIGLWQLRLYGAPLTRNARGVLGVDPLLVAAPAIGLLAGGILAIRIVPRLAEIVERLLERRRGLVGSLGGRQLARRPLRYTRAALLLILAAGLGTFASAHAATWTQSQSDQAAYRAAADLRVAVSDYADMPVWAFGPVYRSVPGVEAAMPVERLAYDGGPKVRAQPLLAIGADQVDELVGFTGDDGPAAPALLDAMVARRPTVDGLELDAGAVRLGLTVVSDFVAVFSEGNVPVPDDARTVRVHVVVQDADGRVHRFSGNGQGPFVGEARVEIPLASTEAERPLQPAHPLRLLAVELEISPPPGVVLEGPIELGSIEVSTAATGDAWRPLELGPDTPGWTWLRADPGAPIQPFDAPGPWRIVFSSDPEVGNPSLFGTATFRFATAMSATQAIPAIVGREFLELTGAQVGEEVAITSRGVRMAIDIVGAMREFPPLDPEVPWVIVDTAALDVTRFAALGQTLPTTEWWLAVDPAREAEVRSTLAGGAYSAAEIVSREALVRDLTGDPVSLGVIGVLGLGAVAALVFAAIGFVVSATVSASERIGEFALLQALGLSSRQLSVWLSLESAVLLIVGVVAGSGLGFLLAWLVLPFATLTETGVAAVPSPTVVIPWQSIAPTWALAAILLVITVVIVRRQLPARRISGVLRARDE